METNKALKLDESEVELMAKVLDRAALERDGVRVESLLPSEKWWSEWMLDARSALIHVRGRHAMLYRINRAPDRPQVAGFYWARCRGSLSGRVYETVVKISSTGLFGGSSKSTVPDTVYWDGVSIGIDDDRLLAFAGPIPTPEE